MNADRVVAFARQDHQGQRGRGEYQLDDHVGGKNGLRTQRRGAQPLEDAALAVDRDNRDQRKHGADGDQKRRENRETHVDKTVGGECSGGWSLRPTTRPTTRKTRTGKTMVPNAPSGSRRKILISIQVSFQSPRSIILVPTRESSDQSVSEKRLQDWEESCGNQ